MKKLKTALLICAIAFAGCYYDKEALLYPESGVCNTANSTYALVVQPILQKYGCIGCHSGSAPSGNILLNSHAAVVSYVPNGKLYGSIIHASGFSAMPQGGNKMTACDANKIKAWIDAGALNN